MRNLLTALSLMTVLSGASLMSSCYHMRHHRSCCASCDCHKKDCCKSDCAKDEGCEVRENKNQEKK
jgi:hypothetical protein